MGPLPNMHSPFKRVMMRKQHGSFIFSNFPKTFSTQSASNFPYDHTSQCSIIRAHNTISFSTSHHVRRFSSAAASSSSSDNKSGFTTNVTSAKNDFPRIFRSTNRDIFFNLSFEDFLFQSGLPVFGEMADQDDILFLYRNSPTVVIGKHQNPWSECRLSEMEITDHELRMSMS